MPLVRSMSVRIRRLLFVMALISPGVLFAPAALAAQPAAATANAIRAINVDGNRRVEPETVRSYLQFAPGDAYDPGKVDGSIKALFATGLFSDVRIDRSGADVMVTVVENPVINQVAFEGNSEVDNDTLRNEVQLKPRAVFTRARVQADVQRILDVYRRQGRYAATVDPKIIELEQDRVNLVFEINEGAATKVKAINFVGNHAFSDSPAARRHLHDADGLVRLPQGHQRLRSGPHEPRSRAAAPVLPEERLCRRAHRLRPTPSSIATARASSSPSPSTKASCYKFGTVDIESALAASDRQALRGELLTKAGDDLRRRRRSTRRSRS